MASESAPRSSSAADSYLGSVISLTSKSEIRYEGVLYNINTDESSIGLRNVRSFGTEGRKTDGPQVPPSDKVYEYILFRGSDIKDLQVKSAPPPQPAPPINNDPAIIQSHFPRPVSSSTSSSSLPSTASGSLTDIGSHNAQLGLPGSNFQGGLPLYQPGGNLGSWGPTPPPNANGAGLAMPMYWQGYYGPANGLPHMHQQPLLRPPPGLSMPSSMQQTFPSPMQQALPSSMQQTLPSSMQQPMPSSMQQPMPSSMQLPMPSSMQQPMPSSMQLPIPSSMQLPMPFPSFNTSLPTGAPNFPEVPSPLLSAASTTAPNLTSTSATSSAFPSSLPSPLPPVPPASLASETLPSLVSNKTPNLVFPASPFNASLQSLAPLTTSSPEISAIVPPISNKPTAVSGQTLAYQTVSQSTSSVVLPSNSARTETSAPSLVTPGQLLQSPPAAVSSSQSSQTVSKDVEAVEASASSSEVSVPVSTEAQPPILPLPPPARAIHKPNGAHFQNRHGYRGRGRGSGSSRPLTRFTEDFDFMAMNEKFNKDEVWGHLGKNNKSNLKEGNGEVSDEDETQHEDGTELSKPESKPVYNKDDFFDSLSCNALNHDSHNGRTRYSEQMKLDTETFGEFSRHRGGRGGRGPGRGGGHFRGGYYGRGNGYMGRGRGRGMASRGQGQ
ncbi:hypothetical protein UlMin_040929 [Ulmus minor]